MRKEELNLLLQDNTLIRKPPNQQRLVFRETTLIHPEVSRKSGTVRIELERTTGLAGHGNEHFLLRETNSMTGLNRL